MPEPAGPQPVTATSEPATAHHLAEVTPEPQPLDATAQQPITTPPASSDLTSQQPVVTSGSTPATAVPADSGDRPAALDQPLVAPTAPSFRERGRLRRRLRYLRRARELGFRDLGGLVFDLHRFGREGSALIAGKLQTLMAVDAELRALETAVDDRRDHVVLREAGIAGCTRCAALHGSDAHFCPNCGLALDRPTGAADADAGISAPAGLLSPEVALGSPPAIEPTPASGSTERPSPAR